MNEIMSQFLTSEVQTVLFALLGIVVVLYLLSISGLHVMPGLVVSAGRGVCFPLCLSWVWSLTA